MNLKPREKALLYGVDSLENYELLAIILSSGVKGKSVFDISKELLSHFQTFSKIASCQINDLLTIKGISKVKALQIMCILEIASRLEFEQLQDNVTIHNPEILSSWLNKTIGFLQQENFIVVFLDTKNKIISYKTIFVGTLNSSIVHPREVFKEAMRVSASKIICAHNHPSFDVMYSKEDVLITKKLIEAGKICGIPVLDHIIVGGNNYLSLKSCNVI